MILKREPKIIWKYLLLKRLWHKISSLFKADKKTAKLQKVYGKYGKEKLLIKTVLYSWSVSVKSL